MKRRSIILALALALATALPPLRAQNTPQFDKLFAAAEHSATVDGDLKAAIEQYQTIIRQAGRNRAVAAKAMLAMADAYQKRGSAEAAKIYREVLSRFSDLQTVADEARRRLTQEAASANVARESSAQRVAWTRPSNSVELYGPVSKSGRYLPYGDVSTGNLHLHDVATGNDRVLTSTGTPGNAPAPAGNREQFREAFVLSPDERRLAYAWGVGFDRGVRGRVDLRILSVAENGSVSSPRVVIKSDDIWDIMPFDWTPDGKRIGVVLQRQEGGTGEIALVSADDGAVRVLRSIPWARLMTINLNLAFARDGRFLAVNVQGPNANDSDILILNTADGSEAGSVSQTGADNVVGWLPEGLIFTHRRETQVSLWVLPWSDGRPGVARPLASNIRDTWTLGLTDSGTMFSFVRNSRIVEVITDIGSAEFETGQVRGLADVTAFVHSREPNMAGQSLQWSPDGRTLAFLAEETGPAIGLYDVASGRTTTIRSRDLHGFTRGPYGMKWRPDGRAIAARSFDIDSRGGIFEVDLASGAAKMLIPEQNQAVQPLGWSATGSFYAIQDRITDYAIMEQRLGADAPRELFNVPRQFTSVSPDTQHLVVRGYTGSKGTLRLYSMADGTARDIFQFNRPSGREPVIWADDRSVILSTAPARESGPDELWWVPIDGRPARRLDGLNAVMSTGALNSLAIHPATQQIAIAVDRVVSERKPSEVVTLDVRRLIH